MTEPVLNIPPIISDWISKINDTTTPVHVKENYILMLENLIRVSEKTVSNYRLARDTKARKR